MEGIVEILGLHVGELVVLGNAGVIDHDVDLEAGVGGGRGGEKLVFGGGNKSGGTVSGAEVGLYCECANAPF